MLFYFFYYDDVGLDVGNEKNVSNDCSNDDGDSEGLLVFHDQASRGINLRNDDQRLKIPRKIHQVAVTADDCLTNKKSSFRTPIPLFLSNLNNDKTLDITNKIRNLRKETETVSKDSREKATKQSNNGSVTGKTTLLQTQNGSYKIFCKIFISLNEILIFYI